MLAPPGKFTVINISTESRPHVLNHRGPCLDVQNQEILCSCWEETASTRLSCCPSQTCASPSPDPVSTLLPSLLITHTSLVKPRLDFSSPFPAALMKIGCDNTVVRMVSSGKFVNRVSFSYRLLDSQELQTIKLNNVEDFCFNN